MRGKSRERGTPQSAEFTYNLPAEGEGFSEETLPRTLCVPSFEFPFSMGDVTETRSTWGS